MKMNLKKSMFDVVNGITTVTKNGISIKIVKSTPFLSTLDLLVEIKSGMTLH